MGEPISTSVNAASTFTIASPADPEDPTAFVEHARGEIAYTDDHVPPVCDLEALRARCSRIEEVSGPRFQDHLAFGPRWEVLRRHALANGIIDAGFNISCEVNRRDAGERSPKWIEHWLGGVRRSVAALEAEIDEWPDEPDMATVAGGCALAYLDIRLKDLLDWREGHPEVAAWYEVVSQRPSMQATAPRM